MPISCLHLSAGHSQHQTSTAAALQLVYTLPGYRLPRVKVVAEMKLLVTFLLVGSAMAQEFQKEADPPLNCQRAEKAKKGDRILMDYTGLLGDGNQFDRGSADFVLGEEKVIKGWEKGMDGQCAGEKITMIVPPELGYGDKPSDKVPADSTLYFLTTLNGIVRVTKAPLGGDCNEGVKARPGQDVTMRIKARVASRDGRGKTFFDKASFEIRFGKPNAIRFVRGLELALTGACVDEKRTLFLGPNLAYGEQGKKDGSVKPGDSVIVEVEILRVRNKKPEDSGLVLGFLDKISSGNLGSFAG